MTAEDKKWLDRAIEKLYYGEVILYVHDGKVVRIDRKERKQVTK